METGLTVNNAANIKYYPVYLCITRQGTSFALRLQFALCKLKGSLFLVKWAIRLAITGKFNPTADEWKDSTVIPDW